MPWPLKIHDARPAEPKPGDCWSHADFLNYPAALSRQYHEQNAGRPPLIICFPCGTEFCVDNASAWDVRGEVQVLTVEPSIRHFGGWHGYVRNGVITDDVDGKVFP